MSYDPLSRNVTKSSVDPTYEIDWSEGTSLRPDNSPKKRKPYDFNGDYLQRSVTMSQVDRPATMDIDLGSVTEQQVQEDKFVAEVGKTSAGAEIRKKQEAARKYNVEFAQYLIELKQYNDSGRLSGVPPLEPKKPTFMTLPGYNEAELMEGIESQGVKVVEDEKVTDLKEAMEILNLVFGERIDISDQANVLDALAHPSKEKYDATELPNLLRFTRILNGTDRFTGEDADVDTKDYKGNPLLPYIIRPFDIEVSDWDDDAAKDLVQQEEMKTYNLNRYTTQPRFKLDPEMKFETIPAEAVINPEQWNLPDRTPFTPAIPYSSYNDARMAVQGALGWVAFRGQDTIANFMAEFNEVKDDIQGNFNLMFKENGEFTGQFAGLITNLATRCRQLMNRAAAASSTTGVRKRKGFTMEEWDALVGDAKKDSMEKLCQDFFTADHQYYTNEPSTQDLTLDMDSWGGLDFNLDEFIYVESERRADVYRERGHDLSELLFSILLGLHDKVFPDGGVPITPLFLGAKGEEKERMKQQLEPLMGTSRSRLQELAASTSSYDGLDRVQILALNGLSRATAKINVKIGTLSRILAGTVDSSTASFAAFLNVAGETIEGISNEDMKFFTGRQMGPRMKSILDNCPNLASMVTAVIFGRGRRVTVFPDLGAKTSGDVAIPLAGHSSFKKIHQSTAFWSIIANRGTPDLSNYGSYIESDFKASAEDIPDALENLTDEPTIGFWRGVSLANYMNNKDQDAKEIVEVLFPLIQAHQNNIRKLAELLFTLACGQAYKDIKVRNKYANLHGFENYTAQLASYNENKEINPLLTVKPNPSGSSGESENDDPDEPRPAEVMDSKSDEEAEEELGEQQQEENKAEEKGKNGREVEEKEKEEKESKEDTPKTRYDIRRQGSSIIYTTANDIDRNIIARAKMTVARMKRLLKNTPDRLLNEAHDWFTAGGVLDMLSKFVGAPLKVKYVFSAAARVVELGFMSQSRGGISDLKGMEALVDYMKKRFFKDASATSRGGELDGLAQIFNLRRNESPVVPVKELMTDFRPASDVNLFIGGPLDLPEGSTITKVQMGFREALYYLSDDLHQVIGAEIKESGAPVSPAQFKLEEQLPELFEKTPNSQVGQTYYRQLLLRLAFYTWGKKQPWEHAQVGLGAVPVGKSGGRKPKRQLTGQGRNPSKRVKYGVSSFY